MTFKPGDRVVARLRGERVVGVVMDVSSYDGELRIKRDNGEHWHADPAKETIFQLLNSNQKEAA